MITRSAANESSCAWTLAFTSTARAAWRLLLERVVFPEGSSLLLPAYIGVTDREGSGIADPVEATGTPYQLYPVGERLEIDLDVIERFLRTGRHPAMLVVHYFGLPQVDPVQLRALCDRHGTLLFEDCAHVASLWGGTHPMGASGHAAFYSLHKVIAAPTGGALRFNDAPFELPVPEGTDRCDRAVLEQLARTNFDAVAAVRRANYSWLAARLAATPGLTVPYPTLGTEVPHDFPVRIHDGLRERLYFALMDDGLPTIALYYRLIDAIRADEFPSSHALSRSILNLPVHQDTSIASLERLVDRLEHHLGRLRT